MINQKLLADLKALNLSQRPYNSLIRALYTGKLRFKSIEELREMTQEQLMVADNLGIKSAREIKDALRGQEVAA